MTNEMVGSEKQIGWAKDIIAGQIKQLNDLIDAAKLRVDNNSMPQVWLDVHTEAVAKMTDRLSKKTDAKSIIDNRVNTLGDRVKKAIFKEYDRRIAKEILD